MASNTKQFPCSQCNRSYDTQAALQQHMQIKHTAGPGQPLPVVTPTNNQQFACGKCNRTYKQKQALDQHLRDAHMETKVVPEYPDNGKAFKCSQCTSSFGAQQSLDQHMQASHAGGQDQKLKCTRCNCLFNAQQSLDQHMQASHAAGQSTPIQVAGQSTPIPATPPAVVCCEVCLKKFQSAASLAQHKQEAHKRQEVVADNGKMFKCSQCTSSFNAKQSLDQHIQASHSLGQGQMLKCTKCTSSFNAQQSLDQHIQASHSLGQDQMLKCTKCNCTFNAQQSLDQHLQASHGLGQMPVASTPSAVISCDLCLKKFPSGIALAQHKQTSHIMKENIQCAYCNKLYKSNEGLDQHVRDKHSSGDAHPIPAKAQSHTQLEPKDQSQPNFSEKNQAPTPGSPSAVYQCSHCATEFVSEVQLSQHQKAANHIKATQNPRKAYIEYIIKGQKMAITPADQRKSIERVKTVLDTLMKHVRSQKCGKMYIPDIHKAGSSAVGAKIGMADEFDTNIPIKLDVLEVITHGTLTYMYKDKVSLPSPGPSPKNLNISRELSDVPVTSIPQGHAVVRVDPNTTPAHLMHGDDLISHKMLQDFYTKLVVALKETKLGDQGVHLSKEAHGPALTLTLIRQDGQHEISVDLTLSLECNKFIQIDSHGWPRPETKKAYTAEKIGEIIKSGTHLVPKGDETWSISYSKAETALLRNIDDGNGCRKAVLKVLKRHFQICKSRSESGLPGISSHIFKTLVLWASENHPGNDHWHESNIDQRVIDTMEEMEHCLIGGKLPYYFCQTTDVLANKDKRTLMELAKYIKQERLKLVNMPSK